MRSLDRSSVSRARVFMIQRFVTKKHRLIAKTEVIPTVSFVSLFHPVIKFVWRSSVTRKILTRLPFPTGIVSVLPVLKFVVVLFISFVSQLKQEAMEEQAPQTCPFNSVMTTTTLTNNREKSFFIVSFWQ